MTDLRYRHILLGDHSESKLIRALQGALVGSQTIANIDLIRDRVLNIQGCDSAITIHQR